jgi:hypothetical protein
MTLASDAATSCHVAVFAAPHNLQELRDVLQSVLGMHPIDAMIQARTAPGILAIPLDRDKAEQLAQATRAIGLPTEVVSDADLESLEHAPVIHHVRCIEGGFDILELHGHEAALVPWDDILLLSVGQVPLETARHSPEAQTTSVKAGRWVGPSSMETPLPPGPEAYIVCRRPFRAFRIDHKRMNYEYLGERKTDSATANFRLFFDDVVSRARQAALTPAARAYLENHSVDEYSFTSPSELQRYTELHLVLHKPRE